MKLDREVKRFGLLLAAEDSDYVKKMYGGYFQVFVQAFGDEGETWDLFRVVEGEFPKIEDLYMYDGFVVSGSPSDAYGDDLWVLQLCSLLQTLHAMHKRVLGICFGHQLLCRAFGGKVGKANGGWDLGVRRVTMMETSKHCWFLQGLQHVPPPTTSIIECHQDEVLELPIGAEAIAFSEKTAVEAFAMRDNILGIQGHPEYTINILYNIIHRLANNNVIHRDFAEEAKVKAKGAKHDGRFWEKACKRFLKDR